MSLHILHKGLPSLLLAFTILSSSAAEPAGYYASAAGLTGTAFRNALHAVIRNGHVAVGYGNSDEAMLVTDQSPTDSTRVVLLYSRRNELKTYFIGNGNPTPPNSLGWNREHQWPNSLGIDDAEPLYSDLFNLRPADETVNNDRGNLPYDESTTGTGYQNPAHAEAPLCTQDADSWEPPAEVKGDIARSMFYMDLRYDGDPGETNLQLTDNMALITTTNAYMGKLSTLLVWHFIDPVSDAERTRNDAVYGYQHNRNPFIDHPEWVEAIFGDFFKLTLSLSGSNVVLTWPAQTPPDMSFIEGSNDLASWTTATLTPTVQGSNRVATIPLASAKRFYRLRLQTKAG
jgi:endonuclease I